MAPALRRVAADDVQAEFSHVMRCAGRGVSPRGFADIGLLGGTHRSRHSDGLEGYVTARRIGNKDYRRSDCP